MVSRNNHTDDVRKMMRQAISDIHTAIVGTIISFNAANCIASVKPALQYHVADGRIIDYPVITGVPVFMPRAGNAQITYPVKAGDSCLLVFSERSLDEWIGKGDADNHDPRQYDLTDAMAFVGMCPAQSISDTNVELINGSTLVSVAPDGNVNITGNVNISGNVNITGNLTTSGTSKMSGSIACDSDITAGNISVQGHTHTAPHGETSSAH